MTPGLRPGPISMIVTCDAGAVVCFSSTPSLVKSRVASRDGWVLSLASYKWHSEGIFCAFSSLSDGLRSMVCMVLPIFVPNYDLS